MNQFQVSILAADCPFYEGPCESIVIPTPQGQYGILAGHSNVIMAVIPGTLFYTIPGEPVRIAAVSSGLVKVENNEVLVLEDIDANRAQRAADEAKEELLQKKSIQEYRSAQAQLARAISRLRVKNRYMESKH